ncbi:MAG: hypothetical protein JNK46_14200 [Methylobacteriaceae bacterium]|nr:hypothetical protein [Methylobacteriaceae bacterium]
MSTTRLAATLALVGVAAAGCARLEGIGGRPVAAPAPAPVAAPVAPGVVAGVPTVDIAAPGQTVRDVLVARARSRGASPSLTAAAVVIQRALPSTNETLAAACGPHQPNRAVRVVLGTQPIAGGTRLTEQRFIIDGDRVCAVPLNEADVREAEASLGEVKRQAETRVAAR